MIYLAVPYSHEDKNVSLYRFNTVNKIAALLMNQGNHVFSPISHSHPIALAGDLPLGWDFWEKYDRKILSICSEVVVLALDGWDRSHGVMNEIRIAMDDYGLPVNLLDANGVLIPNQEAERLIGQAVLHYEEVQLTYEK